MHSRQRHKAPGAAISGLALLAFVSAAFLGGCTGSTHFGDLPTPIALPAGTPERPAVPYVYPAVHDMPPEREARPLTEEQVQRAEAELVAARNRQRGAAGMEKPAARKPKAGTEGAGTTPKP